MNSGTTRNFSVTSSQELGGVFPALFTPLKLDDRKKLNNTIDFEKAKTIIDDLIDVGVNGLVPIGTTGQSPTVSHQQHVDFIKFVCDYVDGRVRVIAGAGSNCTRESIEVIQKIQKSLGRDLAVLCVTGYYNNPPQEGLIQHYEVLSRETGAKIIIYNVPSRTASYLEPETLIHLAGDRNIIGLKQAVDFKSTGKFREDTLKIATSTAGSDFALLAGEDDALFTVLDLGGRGIITAAGNIPEVSRLFLRLIQSFREGDKVESERLQKEAEVFVKAVFIRKNPIPLATMFDSPLYLPLVSLKETKGGEEAYRAIMELIKEKAPSLKKYHN